MADPVKVPPGVAGVLIDADGRVMASATSFAVSGPGGFSQRDAQKHYVRTALANRMAIHLMGQTIGGVFAGYEAGQMMDRLIDQLKWRVSYFDIAPEDAGNG